MITWIQVFANLLENNGVNVTEVTHYKDLDEPATIVVGENRLVITTTADNKYITIRSEDDIVEFTRILPAMEYIKSL